MVINIYVNVNVNMYTSVYKYTMSVYVKLPKR